MVWTCQGDQGRLDQMTLGYGGFYITARNCDEYVTVRLWPMSPPISWLHTEILSLWLFTSGGMYWYSKSLTMVSTMYGFGRPWCRDSLAKWFPSLVSISSDLARVAISGFNPWSDLSCAAVTSNKIQPNIKSQIQEIRLTLFIQLFFVKIISIFISFRLSPLHIFIDHSFPS